MDFTILILSINGENLLLLIKLGIILILSESHIF